MSSGTTMFFDTKLFSDNSKDKEKLDKKIVEYIKYGSLLSAVKFYKDQTGTGLKEAKDYVDSIYAQYNAEKKWDSAMSLTNKEKDAKAISNNFTKK